MHRRRHAIGGWCVAASWLLMGLLAGCGPTAEGTAVAADSPVAAETAGLPEPRVKVVDTGPLPIDRIYPSMTGPGTRVALDTSDVHWVTAMRSEVIDDRTGELMGGEFFCHSMLQSASRLRLAVAATGIDDVRLPEGFGIPVKQILSGIPPHEREVNFFGMVLNNHYPEIDRIARIRGTVEYFTDVDVGSPPLLRKLYNVQVLMLVEDLETYTPPPGQEISDDVSTHCSLVGGSMAHWVVPPGRQITRKSYRNVVPVDSTVHYIATHLHNHGEYVRLTDVASGEVLWQANVEYESERRQIARIPVYSSVEGFPIFADREYEIEAFYNNTADRDVDAMAQMYVYFNPLGDRELFLTGGN